MSMSRIIVQNLSSHVRTDQLKSLFAPYGTITDFKIMKKKAGQSRNFGFIGFHSTVAAEQAICGLHGVFFHGRKLLLEKAHPMEKTKKEETEKPKLSNVRTKEISCTSTFVYGHGVDSLSFHHRTVDGHVQSAEHIQATGIFVVRNLAIGCSYDNLHRLLEHFGQIAKLVVRSDSAFSWQIKNPSWSAIVRFRLPDCALLAAAYLDGKVFQGRILHILLLPPDHKKSRTSIPAHVSRFFFFKNSSVVGKAWRRGRFPAYHDLPSDLSCLEEKRQGKSSRHFSRWKTSLLGQEEFRSLNRFQTIRTRLAFEEYGNTSTASSKTWFSLFIPHRIILARIGHKFGKNTPSAENHASKLTMGQGALTEGRLQNEAFLLLQKEGIVLDSFYPGSMHTKSRKTLWIKNCTVHQKKILHRLLDHLHSHVRHYVVLPSTGLMIITFKKKKDAIWVYDSLMRFVFNHKASLSSKELRPRWILQWAPCSLGKKDNHEALLSSSPTFFFPERIASSSSVLLPSGNQCAPSVNSSVFLKKKSVDQEVWSVSKKISLPWGSVPHFPLEKHRQEPSLKKTSGLPATGFPKKTSPLVSVSLASVSPSGTWSKKSKTINLLIRNLPFFTKAADLRMLFQKVLVDRSIVSIRIPLKKGQVINRGFAFLEFQSLDMAKKVFVLLQNTHLAQRRLNVVFLFSIKKIYEK